MVENDSVNHPSRCENGPFECIELTRLYPFAGGNAIECVFHHRAKNGVMDLRKALWYLDHAALCELIPAQAMTGDSRRMEETGTHSACKMLRILQRADWQDMAPFWKGMWELANGHHSGLTRARKAVARRIALMESDYTDAELDLLDGWPSTNEAIWRLRARGNEKKNQSIAVDSTKETEEAWNDYLKSGCEYMTCLMRDAEKEYMGHTWSLGYPRGMEGWSRYCEDRFRDVRRLAKEERIRLFWAAHPRFSINLAAVVLGVNATDLIRRPRRPRKNRTVRGRTRHPFLRRWWRR